MSGVVSSNIIVACAFLAIRISFGSDTIDNVGTCGIGGCVGDGPSVELLQRDLDLKTTKRHEQQVCVNADDDLYRNNYDDPECCPGLEPCKEERPITDPWHCNNTQPGQQCWKSRIMCRSKCTQGICGKKDKARHSDNMMDECCHGLVECLEKRNNTDQMHCDNVPNGIEGVDCYNNIVMCRESQDSCQAQDKQASACRFQAWHICDDSSPAEVVNMNSKHECFTYCQTKTDGTCCQYNDHRTDGKNCKYFNNQSLKATLGDRNAPAKMAYTMGCTTPDFLTTHNYR